MKTKTKTKGSWPADTPRDICAMTWWPSNAELMHDLVRIGYVDPKRKIVDLTYGRGTWWRMLLDEGHRLSQLHTHDIDRDGVDFRQKLPHRARSAHTVTFDPPYVSTGGRKTSTLEEFNDRYGILYSEKTPELNQERLINPGIKNAARILAPDGKLIVKAANYISSNTYKQAVRWSIEYAESIGLELHDQMFTAGHVRAQPGGRKINHSRNNYSVALIFVPGKQMRKRPAKIK
jgi:hypothetical protein